MVAGKQQACFIILLPTQVSEPEYDLRIGAGPVENVHGISINPGGKPKSFGFYFIKLLRTYSSVNQNHRFPSYIPQSPFF